MNKGKLIVIDGGDGSGKATQTDLLIEYLKKHGIQAKSISFPQYDQFYGSLIGRGLTGEFGDFLSVSPYIISPLYALDRLSAKYEMDKFLDEGGYLVLDRYTTSNMGHQGGKFKTKQERDKYLEWLTEMEYQTNQMPKEDLVIYLYVARDVAKKLTKKETDKKYTEGAQDLAEESDDHQLSSEEMYLFLVDKYPHWKKIDCMKNNQLISIKDIHNKIIEVLKTNRLID